MERYNTFLVHYTNNMHQELFENLVSVSVFSNSMIIEFLPKSDYKIVDVAGNLGKTYEQMTPEEVREKYNTLLENNTDADLEIIYFDMMNVPVKKEVFKNPKFLETANTYCNYVMHGNNLVTDNIIIYNVSFDSREVTAQQQ